LISISSVSVPTFYVQKILPSELPRPILRRAQTSKFSIGLQLHEGAMNALGMRNDQFANQLHFFWFVWGTFLMKKE